MSPELLLRIASVVMFLHLVGHIFGHLTWRKTKDTAKQDVIDRMSQHTFPLMGAQRSLSQLYDGYGYAAALTLLFASVLLWVLSRQVLTSAGAVRELTGLISVFLFAWGIDELLFFFPFAAAFSLLAAVLSAIAFFGIAQ
jgi:hypothetical protein